MKKISLYVSLFVAAVMMTACNESFDDWAQPQSFTEDDAVTIPGFTATPASTATIDLNAIASDSVQLLNLSAAELPAGYEMKSLRAVLTPADDATAEAVTLNAITSDGVFSKNELQDVVVGYYGPRPDARTLNAHIIVDATKDGQASRIDAGQIQVVLTPQAPVIESAYYYVGAANGWSDSDQTYVFTNGGGDVYENPVFTATVPAPYNEDGTRADNWFKIAPESAYTSGDFWNNLIGVENNGDEATEGRLVVGTGFDVGAFNQPASDGATMYRISINMLEQTYTITPITFKVEPAYYYVGAANGWSDSDKTYVFSNGGADPLTNPVYTCVVPAPYNEDGTRADNWFKIAPESAYTSGDFWNNLFGVENDGDTSTSGELAFGNPGAFNQPASDGAKFYRISINPKEMTYEITPLSFAEYFYEIGNESGWGTSHALYGGNGDGKYQGYYYLDGEFKFKPNEGDWNDDLEYVNGDNVSGTLQSTGSLNCPDPGAGFYRIDLDAAGLTYSLTKIEYVSIIGTANGNWDTDTDLTYNQAEGCWEVTTTLNDGEMKFRGNHNWDGDVDLGGSFDKLVHGGSDIAIEAGTYNIKLYISYEGAHHAVVTKQ